MRIEEEWGGDIVFANAGIQAFKPILEMDDRDWHDQIDVNLNGTANVLRVFAPLLVHRRGGRMMKSAALELGRHGITVNAVIPGLIETVLTRHEDRYAQAISSSGQEPAGDPCEPPSPPARAWSLRISAKPLSVTAPDGHLGSGT
jgi:NAD(P)-dependent dehydrogenase (short-subunit alcohol dehydrogenase family)